MSTLFSGWTFTDFGPNRLAPSPEAPRLTLVSGDRPARLKARVQEQCPRRPGVYGMLDGHGVLVYVGKAKNLRSRLQSYFRPNSRDRRSARIVRNTAALAWEVQPSEFAALHRELELIRRWRPRLNVRGQPTGWAWAYVCVGRAPAPYVFLSARPPSRPAACFGPVPAGANAAEAVRRLNDWFKLRDCPEKQEMVFADQGELFFEAPAAGCLRHEIGTCLGPCAAACTRAEYGAAAVRARAFLAGSDRTPLEALAREMDVAAAAQAFERAAALRDRLEPLLWLDAQLAALREARAHGSFVYPVAGFDGSTIWYLINGGRTVAALHPPADAPRAAAARERLRSAYPTGKARDAGEVLEALDGVLLVGSWFRQYPAERSRVLDPDVALRQCELAADVVRG